MNPSDNNQIRMKLQAPYVLDFLENLRTLEKQGAVILEFAIFDNKTLRVIDLNLAASLIKKDNRTKSHLNDLSY